MIGSKQFIISLIGFTVLLSALLFLWTQTTHPRENPEQIDSISKTTTHFDLVPTKGSSEEILPTKLIENNFFEELDLGRYQQNKEKPYVLILTPFKDAANHLENYWRNLFLLTYPKNLISLGFLDGDSLDFTYNRLKKKVPSLKEAGYRRVVLTQKNFSDSTERLPSYQRHDFEKQLERRSKLAKSRNTLLFSALHDEDYVLWLDSDLDSYPPDLIESLLEVKKDIVVPNCIFLPDGKRSYDLNSWQETERSIEEQKNMPESKLLLEGYGRSSRKHLDQLTDQDLVKLDGVGGTALLIRADIHREGLIFPTFIFKHQVETEGIAKMALAMGYQPWGMPNLEIYHR